eukprot:753785-Hanusia_phi.AAC.3
MLDKEEDLKRSEMVKENEVVRKGGGELAHALRGTTGKGRQGPLHHERCRSQRIHPCYHRFDPAAAFSLVMSGTENEVYYDRGFCTTCTILKVVALLGCCEQRFASPHKKTFKGFVLLLSVLLAILIIKYHHSRISR